MTYMLLSAIWRSLVKGGDVVKYFGDVAVVLSRPNQGGTVQVLSSQKDKVVWFVTSECEVISASR